MGKTAGPCRWLAPQTWSVLDFIRTDLRTLRIHRHGKRAGPGAQGGRMATPATGPAPIACRMKAGIHLYRRTGQRAWKEHLISTLTEERTLKTVDVFHPPAPARNALFSKQGRRKHSQRLFKTAFRQGRSERGHEAYSLRYVECLSDARTMLEVVFNSR